MSAYGIAAVGIVAAAILALAACSRQQGTIEPAAAPQATTGSSGTGTTIELNAAIDVIDARIPAPPAGASTAQIEVTLASTTGPDVLKAAATPAARSITFTSNGHPIARLTIPLAAGSSLTTGPPYPDRILLTGLRHPLRPGQAVTITLTFTHAGQATLRVPVTPPVS
jgi:copper(I)-binding protein